MEFFVLIQCWVDKQNVDIKENKNVEYTFYVRGEYEYGDKDGFDNNPDYLGDDDNLIESITWSTIFNKLILLLASVSASRINCGFSEITI